MAFTTQIGIYILRFPNGKIISDRVIIRRGGDIMRH